MITAHLVMPDVKGVGTSPGSSHALTRSNHLTQPLNSKLTFAAPHIILVWNAVGDGARPNCLVT